MLVLVGLLALAYVALAGPLRCAVALVETVLDCYYCTCFLLETDSGSGTVSVLRSARTSNLWIELAVRCLFVFLSAVALRRVLC